ncbi:MAG TPA: PLDc N-terminal domain-containing protein [Candidatus Nanopelagicales bacterium]
MNLLAADFGTGQILWDMLWFFLFIIWIWLLITVFSDIFRSPDMGGGAKALWVIFVVILPYLGVFVYLIARGGKMHEHAAAQVQRQDEAARAYIQNVAGAGKSPAEEVAHLADLRDKGVLTEAEFQAAKAKALA